ncbi:MAG: filamentous hemagglutinin family protein [Betaproteobacteria bacterium]|nr:filamentous hemagglutinin family protein [Betaproteobacteria bacterium]
MIHHRRYPPRRLARILSAFVAAGAVSHVAAEPPLPAGTLPVPTVAPGPGTNIASHGQVSAHIAGTTLMLDQTTPKAVVSWTSFNVASGASVVFRQPDAASAVLNRIFDANPSIIQGSVMANGQIYLVNTNGIVFDRGAQVNAASVVASSLAITPDIFLAGVLSQSATVPAFAGEGGFVRVEPGASLDAGTGGNVWLFAPQVQNGGAITAEGGHILLAAGKKAFLAASSDPSLRGVLVEVEGGGTATNLGELVAERGRTSLVGIAVNQSGRVSATTSVTANGVVELVAQESTFDDNSGRRVPTSNGTVTFGSGSQTRVLPAQSGETSTDAQVFLPSRIDVTGKRIEVGAGAMLQASGGSITMTAIASPNAPIWSTPGTAPTDARIFVGQGAVLDVSGTTDVVLEASRNFLTLELRGNELKDAPLQKDGPLRGQSVTIDVRKGTPLADVSSAIAQVGRTARERLAVAGAITLKSEGDVLLAQGSALKVDGGVVTYLPGNASTTRLRTLSGEIVDIGTASADQQYSGIVEPPATARFEPGYFEGRNAGTVEILAHKAVLDGTLSGQARNGLYQRDPVTMALGGRLVLGDAAQDSPNVDGADFRLGDITVTGDTVAHVGLTADTPSSGIAEGAVISRGIVTAGGFSRLAFYSAGTVRVMQDAPLHVQPAGTVSFTGRTVEVDADIVAPGGSIALATRKMFDGTLASSQSIRVGEGVRLSTSGTWVNESPYFGDRGEARVTGAGGISMSSRGAIRLGESSVLDVSAGAWLDQTMFLHTGRAGAVSLVSNTENSSSVNLPHDHALSLGGSLLGYALQGGGTLSLTAGSVTVGTPGSGTPGELPLAAEFFSAGGFQRYSVTGLDGVSLDGSVDAVLANRVLVGGYAMTASADSLAAVSRTGRLEPIDRQPVSLSFVAASTYLGTLAVAPGAFVRTDPRGSVSLAAGFQLNVEGRVEAPGGSIALTMTGSSLSADDRGFVPGQSIWLGSGAHLSVRGAVVAEPDARGYIRGTVLDGGRLTVQANKGDVIARSGAVLDVSGTSGALDIEAQRSGRIVVERALVGSAGGTLELQSREAILSDATLLGAAGSSADQGGARPAGGTLSFILDRQEKATAGAIAAATAAGYPGDPLVLELRVDGTAVPEGLVPAQHVDPSGSGGTSRIILSTFAEGGFDSLQFKARNVVSVPSSLTLMAGRRIEIDAPALWVGAGANAVFEAPSVAWRNVDARYQTPGEALAGTGTLRISAGLVDLAGNMVTQGVGAVILDAGGGDVRLQGVLTDDLPDVTLDGSLRTRGDFTVRAGQLYPATLSRYAILTPGRFAVRGAGSATVPLSAGGSLIVEAGSIEILGTVRAPQGTISLKAADSLGIGEGALLSVAGGAIPVPLGRTQNGALWIYDMGDRRAVIGAPLAKTITLDAPDIVVAGPDAQGRGGAVVDLAAGGAVTAHEFVSGPGGSRDFLGDDGVHAILPSLGSSYAPLDWQNAPGGTAPVRTIHLSGVIRDGSVLIPEGDYALLPGHYALLPGAYAVRVSSTGQDMVPIQNGVQPDGSLIASGYSMIPGTVIRDSRTSAYVLTPESLLRKQAEFDATDMDSFFAAAAQKAGVDRGRGPADAGQLVLAATRSLVLDGSIRFDMPASGAMSLRGGWMDISVPAITLGGPAAPADGSLWLSGERLSDLAVESLVVGGRRTRGAAGEPVILVSAATVRVADRTELRVPDLILAATGTVQVGEGATLVPGSVTGSDAPGAYAMEGDGAIVRVTGGPAGGIRRTGTPGSRGEIAVGPNVEISAHAALLDASRDTRVDASARLDVRELALASSRITVGGAAAAGLVVTGGLLSSLEAVDTLRLKSYGSIDFIGDVILGGTGASVPSGLVLDAAGIGGSGNTLIAADHLTLTNSGTGTGSSLNGGGRLTLRATSGDVVVDAGAQSINGFARVRIDAARDLVFRGEGALSAGGDVEIAAGRIVAANGANHSLQAGGFLSVERAASLPPESIPDVPGLGARLALTGAAVTLNAEIRLPAGRLRVASTGTSASQGVLVGSGAVLDAGGGTRTFFDAARAVPSGEITLESVTGDVRVLSGAAIDVSADAGADAGTLIVSAPAGQVLLEGTLQGDAQGGGQAGTLRIDSASATVLRGLAGRLAAGGFSGELAVRVRSGDLEVSAADVFAARSIVLQADAGRIDVRGSLDASATNGGRIELWAGTGLAVTDSGHVEAAGAAGEGGHIVLGTASGNVVLDAGAQVSVAGAGGFTGGSVLIRAPRVGNDVAVTTSATIEGSRETVVEAYRVYAGVASISTALRTSVNNDIGTFMAQAASVAARLGYAGDPTFHVRPGVELRSTGNMTLPADWDFHTATRAGNEPGILTLRAAGTLALNGSLSDGFNSVSATGTLQSGESWSFRLVGGADTASANPITVRSVDGTAGDVRLASGKLVRTGTGSIDIAAANELQLAGSTSVVYTAGTPSATPDGFAVPRNAFYPERGGDIRLQAGSRIVAAASTQWVSDWLHRQGRVGAGGGSTLATSWWVLPSEFRQGVAALGGGDVSVRAGGDIVNLHVSVPTTGRLAGTDPATAVLVVTGGGDIVLDSGGSILGGGVFAGGGDARVLAAATAGGAGTNGLGTVFSLAGDSTLGVVAQGDVSVDAVFNPTVTPQAKSNVLNLTEARASFFFTYGPAASAEFVSVYGDVVLRNDATAIKSAITAPASGLRTASSGNPELAYEIYPASLSLRSFGGAVEVRSAMALYPAASGALELLAARDVRVADTIYMSDHDPGALAGIRLPESTHAVLIDRLQRQAYVGQDAHHSGVLHAADTIPVRIYAEGDVIGPSPETGAYLGVFPKALWLRSAGDVQDASFYAQNARASDLTLVEAGRDVVFTTALNADRLMVTNGSRIEVGGPGRLEVLAGRDLDLANSLGILTRGNLVNPALPVTGASISAGVGFGRTAAGGLRYPDFESFGDTYLSGGAAAQTYRLQLMAYLAGLGVPVAEGSDPLAAFAALPEPQRLPFVSGLLFEEIKASGRFATVNASRDFSRGFEAIAALFDQPAYAGDARLFLSQIKTERDGTIDLLAPGGSVNAGLAVPPADLGKSASQLGIVTVDGGSVRSFVRDDFLVNQSRVFTLGGGDILVWASTGNVDAGRGSKNASYAPPPVVIVRADGTVETDLQASVSGSGIGVLLTRADAEPGSVDLYAPRGFVDAGDAGIVAAGDLYLAGQQVVCTAGCRSEKGAEYGVPVTSTLTGASVTGVGSVALEPARNIAERIRESVPVADASVDRIVPHFIRVEVLGFGDRTPSNVR